MRDHHRQNDGLIKKKSRYYYSTHNRHFERHINRSEHELIYAMMPTLLHMPHRFNISNEMKAQTRQPCDTRYFTYLYSMFSTLW